MISGAANMLGDPRDGRQRVGGRDLLGERHHGRHRHDDGCDGDLKSLRFSDAGAVEGQADTVAEGFDRDCARAQDVRHGALAIELRRAGNDFHSKSTERHGCFPLGPQGLNGHVRTEVAPLKYACVRVRRCARNSLCQRIAPSPVTATSRAGSACAGRPVQKRTQEPQQASTGEHRQSSSLSGVSA